jgi:hypothetical protein
VGQFGRVSHALLLPHLAAGALGEVVADEGL